MKRPIRVVTFQFGQNQGVNIELGTHTLEVTEHVAEQNSGCIGPWFEPGISPVQWAAVGPRRYKIVSRGGGEVIYILQQDAEHLPDRQACLFQKHSKKGLMTLAEFREAVNEMVDSLNR
jgi:hypothetical protein